ncbi:uncharacterized protein PHALS_06797 [Plasmopara halstedii]|uniref:Uncharacterized protein n=1 Tax=Plasmopara halstedii TaxID=4781 RepID=A0A0P1B2Q5_PLAHL|nr:uncharacterized protein PHALS_06797 [Plasmopara halstedii]CEG49007.1 hypothetical protein PHALS_06797 [Plasmopara halstedii]|eukprot:XP_024585376.1 hypothetical protein PHALS_06797 [Plasmopara halstedii]
MGVIMSAFFIAARERIWEYQLGSRIDECFQCYQLYPGYHAHIIGIRVKELSLTR